MQNQYIFIAKEYYLVVGEQFELFYRGVIKMYNPYQFYIAIKCKKGTPYPRYYTFTPQKQDIGNYELTIQLIDNDGKIIEQAQTNLIVKEAVKPTKKVNILCIGDSLTVNGVWPKEGYRHFCLTEGEPKGNGLGDCLNFIGKCSTEIENKRINYEGYGGWTWASYISNDHIGLRSSVWVKTNHHKTERDQHSIWESNGHLWILETIEKNWLKFKRGENNISMISNLGDKLHHVENANDKTDIIIEEYKYEDINPFWNQDTKQLDIKKYLDKNNFPEPDLIYILLTWNGLGKPYNDDFSHHILPAKTLLRHFHTYLPNAKITLMGIQICSVNGGIPTNYGAWGAYSDLFGTITNAFNYNLCLEKLAIDEEFNSYVSYVDTKAQFDSEYNMPYVERPVNARSLLKEMIGTNGVHPNQSGYLQIGDCFYRKLVHDLNKISK